MQTTTITTSLSSTIRTLLCVSLACVPSCGKESGPAVADGSGGVLEEAPLGHPASPAEAAKFLDLTTFPLMPGVPETRQRTLANLSYPAKSDVKAAYDFQKKNLESMKWRESPGSAVTAEYASGTFMRAGFVVSVMVSPSGEPGTVEVVLHNQGNVDLAKLPLPAGTKPVYVGPLSAMHVTGSAIAATAEECRKLLTAAGWQPFGGAGDSVYYKQNAILLTATVCAAPAQDGKTMISYGSEQMSADIPEMPGAEGLRYTDTTGRLDFDTASSEEEVEQFYRKALSGRGWAATMDHIVKVDNGKDFVVFRNPAKDMVTLEMQKMPEGRTRVSLFHQSAVAVADEDRRFKDFKEKRTKEAAAAAEKKGEPAPEMPKVSVTVPAGAGRVEQKPNGIKFTVGDGKAKAAVEAMQKQFLDAGWKKDAAALEGIAGSVSLSKDGRSLSITYTDTGIMPAEIEVTVIGAVIEMAGTAG